MAEETGGRRERIKGALSRALPPDTGRRRVARVGLQVARDGRRYARHVGLLWDHATQPVALHPDYRDWLNDHRLAPGEIAEQARVVALRAAVTPLEVFVVDDGDPTALRRTLNSLAVQSSSFHNDHVLSVDDGTDVFAARIADLPPHAMVSVVAAGDVLEPDWVFEVTATAHDDPVVDLIGWDDDVVVDGRLVEPRFRPAWSPDTLLGANYLGRSVAVRQRALAGCALGLPGPGSVHDDAAWWALLLALGLNDAVVRRVPRVLAHLVRRPDATADARRGVVGDHLRATGRSATLTDTPDGVSVHWEPSSWPTVSIVIPTRHNRTMLQRCLPSLATTDYPSFDVTVVDNGGHTADNAAWYESLNASLGSPLALTVQWWDEPFNYGRVNNLTAATTGAEVLVFLNDDTEVLDPAWLRELVGWATQDEVGLAGMQLLAPDDTIQHGGVVLGMNGFADHLFEGARPGTDSMFGPTWWIRDCLSVTAACVAISRDLFDAVGGFDERFVLCGSDVVLGLDARDRGQRSVVVPFAGMRHLESATRGTSVPNGDFHASWWRYQKYLRGGDPYFSPNLSLRDRIPSLRSPKEAGPLVTVGDVLGRSFAVFRQSSDAAESAYLAETCQATDAVVDGVAELHAATVGRREVRTVNWHVPDIDSPFYGGINTALRIADTMARNNGVENRFIVTAAPNEAFFRSALSAAFPAIADSPMVFTDGHANTLTDLPEADVAIATLWTTAYQVAKAQGVGRKFYLIQDFEPMFYPAGTNYALCEEGYRLGLYGLCNTHRLRDLYAARYRGRGWSFMPAVADEVFHARGRTDIGHDGCATVFVYARPGHWRNCWELASPALEEVKRRLGDDVRIVTAGSWARPEELGSGIRHLGLLDYAETGELYRRCDVGVALTVSEHPSYLPLELMACGVPVVAFDNPAGDWILDHGVNSLRARRTVDGLADAITTLAADPALRASMSAAALDTIATGFASWDHALGGIHDYLCDPDAHVEASAPTPWEGPR